jgi:hypothetical protein
MVESLAMGSSKLVPCYNVDMDLMVGSLAMVSWKLCPMLWYFDNFVSPDSCLIIDIVYHLVIRLLIINPTHVRLG